MRINDSGHVRFTRNGYRFDVSNAGVKVYSRTNSSYWGGDTEYAVHKNQIPYLVMKNWHDVSNAVGLLKINQCSNVMEFWA